MDHLAGTNTFHLSRIGCSSVKLSPMHFRRNQGRNRICPLHRCPLYTILHVKGNIMNGIWRTKMTGGIKYLGCKCPSYLYFIGWYASSPGYRWWRSHTPPIGGQFLQIREWPSPIWRDPSRNWIRGSASSRGTTTIRRRWAECWIMCPRPPVAIFLDRSSGMCCLSCDGPDARW